MTRTWDRALPKVDCITQLTDRLSTPNTLEPLQMSDQSPHHRHSAFHACSSMVTLCSGINIALLPTCQVPVAALPTVLVIFRAAKDMVVSFCC